MLSKRTSKGVPLRKIQGVKTTRQIPSWILVADRHRLCLFEKTKDEAGPALELRESWTNPQGKKKSHELVTDRPGRNFNSRDKSRHGQTGGTRHGYAGAADANDQVLVALANQAVKVLKRTTRTQPACQLTLVAGPTLWGTIRPQLKRSFPKMTVRLHEKDFAWLTEDKVKARLKKLVL